jgi:DNA repair exonuclease SbcCD nuclease subunit
MPALITADIHCSANPRDRYRLDFLKNELPKEIKKRKVDTLFVLGDATEAKDEHSAELVNEFVDIVKLWASLCVVVFLKGNHDFLSSPDNPFFRFLRHIPNVVWINQPTKFAHQEIGDVVLLPFSPNYKKDWADVDFASCDWAFCHQTFAGAVSESGYRPDGIPLSYFPSELQIISGDIHNPQTFGNCTYIGSPYSIDFGDAFTPRLLLFRGGELSSIRCGGPQKRLLDLDFSKKLEIPQEFEKGDLIKVRVKLTAKDFPKWAAISNEIRQELSKSFLVNEIKPIVEAPSRSMLAKQKDAPKKSDEQLLGDYAKHRGVDEETLKAGQRLL